MQSKRIFLKYVEKKRQMSGDCLYLTKKTFNRLPAPAFSTHYSHYVVILLAPQRFYRIGQCRFHTLEPYRQKRDQHGGQT